MSDLEARIRTVLLEDASRVPLVQRMPEHVRPRVRRRRAVTVLTASLAACLLIAGSVFAVRSIDRSSVMPAPPAPASPISEDWMLEHSLGISNIFATHALEDPRDASVAGVDITRLKFSGSRWPAWYLELAGPPKERTTGEVLSYGLVLDTTQDGAPDYLVGIEDVTWWVSKTIRRRQATCSPETSIRHATPVGSGSLTWRPARPTSRSDRPMAFRSSSSFLANVTALTPGWSSRSSQALNPMTWSVDRCASTPGRHWPVMVRLLLGMWLRTTDG